MLTRVGAVVLAFMALNTLTEAFYVPGVAPTDYSKGEEVEIKVSFEILIMFKSSSGNRPCILDGGGT